MRKSFRDKLMDALAKKHIRALSPAAYTGKITDVDLVTAVVAFRYFWDKSFLKEIIWSNVVKHAYTGMVYIGGYRLIAQGETKKEVIEQLARKFCDTVPLFTASGKEIERQVEA